MNPLKSYNKGNPSPIHNHNYENIERRSETTAHEICQMLFHSFAGERSFADAIDEIAAISCESDKSIQERLEHYTTYYMNSGVYDWDQFLTLEHPIKTRSELVAFLEDNTRHAGTSIRFTVESRAQLGREIGLFYSQSAVFAAFWRKLCPAQGALGKIAVSLSNRETFSHWLQTNDLSCGPKNMNDFNDAITSFLNHPNSR